MVNTENALPQELANPTKRVVGMKQVLRFANSGQLEKIYIAANVDAYVREAVVAAAKSACIETEEAESKEILGKACGIKVCAACAGIIK